MPNATAYGSNQGKQRNHATQFAAVMSDLDRHFQSWD